MLGCSNVKCTCARMEIREEKNKGIMKITNDTAHIKSQSKFVIFCLVITHFFSPVNFKH
jgi:hypothetical protein